MTRIDRRMAELANTGRAAAPRGRGLAEVALAATEAAPDRLIVKDNSRALTRAELLDVALRLGGGLRARGLAKGAVLAFQLPNWWEACAINLCAALFGYRVVPLMPIYRQAELGQIFQACGVDAIFVPDVYRKTNYPELVTQSAGAPEHVLTLRGVGGPDSFEGLAAHAPGTPDPAETDDAKLVIFTSGSTGRPKGVIHSHDTMDVLIRDAAAFWDITEDDRLFVPSPIGHVGGAIYAFEFPWLIGCAAYLEERWSPEDAVARIDQEKLTFMAGATPFLSGLLEAADMVGSDLPSLRRFICGGAAVPPELIRRALERFPNTVVSRAFGSSEVPLVCPGVRSREDAATFANTDGECTAELRLIDAALNDVPDGAAGEIAVRAPQMLTGYLDAADEANAFTDDGYFRMGDLGALTDGRYLTITGRIKDIIIRKGENISPLEIEAALLRHPVITHCAVVGRPDADRGEMVVAFLAVAGDAFTMDDMAAHLSAQGLARQKFPEELVVLPELPMNTVGKIQKEELRAMARERAEATA